MLIPYIHSYPQLASDFFICNLRTRHAVVTTDPLIHYSCSKISPSLFDRYKNRFGLDSQPFFSFLRRGETESTWYGALYQSQTIDGECGSAVWGIRIGRGNRNTRTKLPPVSLCPQQIPHDLTCVRTRPETVGSYQLTAWAMARPQPSLVRGEDCQVIAHAQGKPLSHFTFALSSLFLWGSSCLRVNSKSFCDWRSVSLSWCPASSGAYD
jgi:hypothetical protein